MLGKCPAVSKPQGLVLLGGMECAPSMMLLMMTIHMIPANNSHIFPFFTSEVAQPLESHGLLREDSQLQQLQLGGQMGEVIQIDHPVTIRS